MYHVTLPLHCHTSVLCAIATRPDKGEILMKIKVVLIMVDSTMKFFMGGQHTGASFLGHRSGVVLGRVLVPSSTRLWVKKNFLRVR